MIKKINNLVIAIIFIIITILIIILLKKIRSYCLILPSTTYEEKLSLFLDKKILPKDFAKSLPPILEEKAMDITSYIEKYPDCSTVTIIPELNKVYIANKEFYISDNIKFIEERNKKIEKAIQLEFMKALTRKRAFKFPDYSIKDEKYMDSDSLIKHNKWKEYISVLNNNKLAQINDHIIQPNKDKYIQNSDQVLNSIGVKKENIGDSIIKRLAARELIIKKEREKFIRENTVTVENNEEYAMVKKITDEITMNDIIKLDVIPARHKSIDELFAQQENYIDTEQHNRDNSEQHDRNNVRHFLDMNGIDILIGDINDELEKIRHDVNKKNISADQSVHDSIFRLSLDEAISDCKSGMKIDPENVNKLAIELSEKYPDIKKHRELFVNDKDKDYMKCFSSIVYHEKNKSVKDDILEIISKEIEHIAPVCEEGRRNKTWSLLANIDKTGFGKPLITRSEVLDNILTEGGKIVNEEDDNLSIDDRLYKIDMLRDENIKKYPGLINIIPSTITQIKDVLYSIY